MEKRKVVHYVNQFLGKIGGEDKAGVPPECKDGSVGVGALIERCSGGRFEVVKTIVCGDNYAVENLEEVERRVLRWVEEVRPDIFLAGPALGSGRHGIACGTFCRAVREKLGIPALTAMHQNNPGVEIARRTIYIIETGTDARDMKDAVARLVTLAQKVIDGAPIGLPGEEGYFPKGIRKNIRLDRRGSRRAVDMLLKKLRSEPFETELSMPVFDRVAPAAPIDDLSQTLIALATEGGIVPRGNPDRIRAHNSDKYCKYFIGNMDDLTAGAFETAHGGYDPVFANQDPDRVMPLDACRQLEKEGAFGKLHEYFFSTVGNVTAVASAARFGREIGEDCTKEGIRGIILTST